MQYTIVEISETMINRCKATLAQAHPQLMASGQLRFVNCGIKDYPHHCTDTVYVIMLEVLDNMPHERIYFDSKDEPIGQAMVEINESDHKSSKEVISKTLNRNSLEVFKMWRDVNTQQETVDRSSKHETLV
jgi:SAM-dependent MidA family methyltransferase